MLLGMTTHSDDHALAAELATAAGELLLRTREEHAGTDPKELKDIGDRVSHDFLMAELATARPDDAVLSEEGAEDPHLRLSLPLGIGMHHAGLSEKDRELSMRLFAQGVIQVLVCTARCTSGGSPAPR